MADERGVALITGASSGIGMATALYMAERGYRVVGTSRAKERLAELEAEAGRRGLPVAGVELDINDEAGLPDALAAVVEQHGPIERARQQRPGTACSVRCRPWATDELRAQFETNVFAVVRLMRAVLPGMIERGGGTIVNVSSILGRIGAPFHGAYACLQVCARGTDRVAQDGSVAPRRARRAG